MTIDEMIESLENFKANSTLGGDMEVFIGTPMPPYPAVNYLVADMDDDGTRLLIRSYEILDSDDDDLKVHWIVDRINEIFDGNSDWEYKYDTIFEINKTQLVPLIGWIDWCDPDTTYEEDITAFVMALRDYMRRRD